MRRLLVLGVLLLLTGVCIVGCTSRPTASSDNLLQEVKQRGYFVIGTKYDAPPFGYLDTDGQVKGYEIDLAQELAKRILGNASAIKTEQVNSSTRVAMLDAKHIDFVLATMTITPERAEVVNFTLPYYKAAQGVMVKESSTYQSLQDLAHQKVIYVIGATGEANLKKALPQAQLLGFKSSMEAFSAFNAGRGEAFSTDDAILYGFLHEYCGVRLLKDRISEEPYGIAFRKDKASQPLQQAIQAELDNLAKEGYLDQLRDKWLKPYPPAHCSR